MIRNPNKTKSPTEKTKKPNGENKKAQVLSGAAYITASQRALNIFFLEICCLPTYQKGMERQKRVHLQ